MDTNEIDWVKTSERPASEHAYPLFVWENVIGKELYISKPSGHWPSNWTHWRCSKKVAPPPRELTQREKDEEATAKWVNDNVLSVAVRISVNLIKRAICEARADERREVLAMLQTLINEENARSILGKPLEPWRVNSLLKPLLARLETQGD